VLILCNAPSTILIAFSAFSAVDKLADANEARVPLAKAEGNASV
jgi:hypothetical protein